MKKNSGFSIVEVSVGATITVIIGAILVGLQYIIGQNQLLVFDQSVKVELANTSTNYLVKELRTARGGDNGAYTIESGNSQSISFYSDVDFDGQAEKVRYFIQGTELRKGVIEPTGYPVTYPSNTEKIRIISENVRNGSAPLFYYYNGDWPTDTTNNPLAVPIDPDTVKMIRVYLRINSKANDVQGDYVLDSYVHLRTLKDNL